MGLGPLNLDAAIRDQPLSVAITAVPVEVPNHHHEVRPTVTEMIRNAVGHTRRSVAIDFCEMVPNKVHRRRRETLGVDHDLRELVVTNEVGFAASVVRDEVTFWREHRYEMP
jgi:hypothetical protein